MKKTMLGLMLAAFAGSVSAAPIVATVGINNVPNEGIVAPVDNLDMSVDFTSTSFGTGTCSNAMFCSGASMIGSSTMSSGGPTTVTWGTGELVYNTTSNWSVIETVDPSTGASSFTVGTTGTYSSSIAGYDPTPGNLVFSFQDPIITDQTRDAMFYSFSASGATSPVPEPASMALLGFGLLGIGLISRRRKSAES